MITDRVGDFIVRLQNAAMTGRESVSVPHSNHLEAIAKKLKELGFLTSVSVEGEVKKMLVVTLAYASGEAKIRGVRRMSKPGRRLYVGHAKVNSVKGGTGARLVSSPRGILSDKEARQVKVGGEELFEIW